MDYSTLQARVLARLNMTTNDPAAANVDEYVNEAIHYLESAAPDGWPWMRAPITVSTVAGTSTHTLASLGTTAGATVSKVLSAKILNGTTYQDMMLLSPADAVERYPSTNQNMPQAWFVEGSSFYLYPTPDAVYTMVLRVITVEPDLTGNGSTPVLPVVFHTAIVEAAVLLFYETLQDSTKLQLAEQRVDSYVNRMRRYGRQYPSAPKIRVREWL